MEKALTFIFILLVFLTGISWALFSPYVSEIREVRQKIRQGQDKVEKLHLLSRQSEEMDKEFSLLQEDIQYLDLPGAGQTDSLSDAVRSKGKECGLNVLRVNSDYSFGLERAGSSHDRLTCMEIIPFNLQIEGHLPDICHYFEWLEGLPWFLGIEQVEISRLLKDLYPFPVLRVNMVLRGVGVSRRGEGAIRHLQRETDFYRPVQLAPSLISAQKNLRITALEKDMFDPEQDKGGYVLVEGEQTEDTGSQFWGEESRAGVSLRDLILNGIVSYQGKYIALINDQRVSKGDSIAGMEVMWITRDSICLAKGSEKFMLSLNK